MNFAAAVLVTTPLLFLSLILLPSSVANRGVLGLRRLLTAVAGLHALISLCALIARLTGQIGDLHVTLFSAGPVEFTIMYEGVSALMMALVSFVGWVICRYSVRYLDGEATQGRYFRWTGFSIGAVCLMVLSGNLLMFVAAWMMTSLGLHQLLLHYSDRPAAQRAAWSKFGISRLGDASLIGAMVLLYQHFQTLDFSELFAAANAMPIDGNIPASVHWAGALLILGGVTKSAQFPFHTWLPLTMETPTPVSALMHAGIVNAGGFLIIRCSPLLVLTPWALTGLAIIGGFTACFAAVVMLTQTSVKKTLAYSTIAQMGFMMLQCGLGGFSAAMLHILAHSLYKANAFLSSGSVMQQAAATRFPASETKQTSLIPVVAVGGVVLAMLVTALWLFGIDPITKPGGLVLSGVLTLALTDWLGRILRSGTPVQLARGLVVTGGLCLFYGGSYAAVDAIVDSSLPSPIVSTPVLTGMLTAVLLITFACVFGLHRTLLRGKASDRMQAWYVHASNGFYIESMLRRRFQSLAARGQA